MLLWVAGALLVLLLAAGLLIYSVLHGGPGSQYVAGIMQKKAAAALNTPVHLQKFNLDFSKDEITLNGVTVAGAKVSAPNVSNTAPLLQVQKLQIGAPLGELLHGKLVVNSIVIDHPVVHLIINAQGETNIPNFSSNNSSSTSVWDMGIQHAGINNGEIYVNDVKNTLDADLHQLMVQANRTSNGPQPYSGTLSYTDGHLIYNSYAPIPHDLQAKFEVGPSGLNLSDVKLTSGASQLLMNASVENYSKPAIHAKYIVMLSLDEVRGIMKDASIPSGTVLVNGVADYNSVAGKPALQTASLNGTISSQLLQVKTATLNSDIRQLSAHYDLSHGNAELRDISARLLGGILTANATVKDITGKQQGHLVADLHDVSAGDLKRVAASAALKPVAISGHVNARMVADWTGSIRNLLLQADGSAAAQVRPAHATTTAAVPVNAVAHARYDARQQTIGLQNSYVMLPQTTIRLNGTVSRRSALQVSVHSSDLAQLEDVVETFAKPSSPLPPVSGAASFDGTVRGTTSAPQIAGQLTATNLQAEGADIARLSTRMEASPSSVSLQNGSLQLAHRQGHATFDIQSALDDWSHTPNDEFNIKLNASQVALAELARLAKLNTPMSGTLEANVVAHGTELQPIGQGQINLRNANIDGEPLELAQVHFQGTGEAVNSNLLIQVSGGKATGQLTYYPKQQGYDGAIQATNIQLGQLEILRSHNLPMQGTLSLTASGRGTFSNPEATASVTIPQLEVQGQKIQNISFQGDVANHQATFNLSSAIMNTPLTAQGTVALNGDYYANATMNTPVIPIQPLLAIYAPSAAANITGQTEIHASVRGPLKNMEEVQAQLEIPTLAVNYTASQAPGATPKVLRIAAVTPIHANYSNGVLALQPGEIKGTDTDVRFQGNLPLKGNTPSTINVQGEIDLAVMKLFDPDVTSSGQMVLDINAAGYKSQPNVEGQIRIVNASFSTPDAPLGMTKGNGVITLRRDRMDITQFSANVGGGTVTASGGMIYQPAIHYDIGLKGDDLRMLYPSTVRTDFGVNLVMAGNTRGALVTGQVNINGISVTPEFDLIHFVNQFNTVATPPPTAGFEDNLRLNVALRSTSELNVVSPTVSIQGSANLRVIGTVNDPVIVGRSNLTGGDVIFLGNRYLVQGGTIAFLNTVQTEPVVNLAVTTTIQQYNITMRFRGPIERLRTDYTSDPALAQADIIHLIAFGNTEEAANAAPQQSAALGAESLIASQVTSQVTGRLQKALGVSQISLDPQLGSTVGDQQQGARLTVRQRVTSKLYVTFSTDVTTTQYSAVQLQYQMNRKWSVSGVRDQNGGFSVDGRYHKDF